MSSNSNVNPEMMVNNDQHQEPVLFSAAQIERILQLMHQGHLQQNQVLAIVTGQPVTSGPAPTGQDPATIAPSHHQAPVMTGLIGQEGQALVASSTVATSMALLPTPALIAPTGQAPAPIVTGPTVATNMASAPAPVGFGGVKTEPAEQPINLAEPVVKTEPVVKEEPQDLDDDDDVQVIGCADGAVAMELKKAREELKKAAATDNDRAPPAVPVQAPAAAPAPVAVPVAVPAPAAPSAASPSAPPAVPPAVSGSSVDITKLISAVELMNDQNAQTFALLQALVQAPLALAPMALAQPVLSAQPALAPTPSAPSQLAPPTTQARKSSQKGKHGQANPQAAPSASSSENKPPARGATNKKASVSGSTTASNSAPTAKTNSRKRSAQHRLTAAEKKTMAEEAAAKLRAEAEARRQLANLQRDQRNPTYKPFHVLAVKDYTNSK